MPKSKNYAALKRFANELVVHELASILYGGRKEKKELFLGSVLGGEAAKKNINGLRARFAKAMENRELWKKEHKEMRFWNARYFGMVIGHYETIEFINHLGLITPETRKLLREHNKGMSAMGNVRKLSETHHEKIRKAAAAAAKYGVTSMKFKAEEAAAVGLSRDGVARASEMRRNKKRLQKGEGFGRLSEMVKQELKAAGKSNYDIPKRILERRMDELELLEALAKGPPKPIEIMLRQEWRKIRKKRTPSELKRYAGIKIVPFKPVHNYELEMARLKRERGRALASEEMRNNCDRWIFNLGIMKNLREELREGRLSPRELPIVENELRDYEAGLTIFKNRPEMKPGKILLEIAGEKAEAVIKKARSKLRSHRVQRQLRRQR